MYLESSPSFAPPSNPRPLPLLLPDSSRGCLPTPYDDSLMWGVGVGSPISGRLGGFRSGGEMLDSGSRNRPVPSASSLRGGILSWSAPLSDSLLLLSATCGGLFTSCHLLPHVGEQSVLTRSAVRSISPAPVTRFPFPIYPCLCSLSLSVCLFVFCLTLHVEISSLLSFYCVQDPQARSN